MIESKLTELLERTAAQTTVGPPPLDAMRAGASRRRRRRTAAWSAVSAAAVAAVIAGTILLATQGSGDPQPPIASAGPVPAGMRLVGYGHAAIAVPKDWGTNVLNCGTPQKDTVVIDVGFVTLCMPPYPPGVESVELGRGKPHLDFHADQSVEIDGVPALRQRTSCGEGSTYSAPACSGTVVIPSLDVWFRAESTTNAAEVDRLLSRIVVVPDRVGVPGYRTLGRSMQGATRSEYADVLKRAGLKAEFETKKAPDYRGGQVLDVSPGPGTMLPPGATVTVTVAGS